MSAVEPRQMSAIEKGQMSAAEMEQMPAVDTRQIKMIPAAWTPNKRKSDPQCVGSWARQL